MLPLLWLSFETFKVCDLIKHIKDILFIELYIVV